MDSFHNLVANSFWATNITSFWFKNFFSFFSRFFCCGSLRWGQVDLDRPQLSRKCCYRLPQLHEVLLCCTLNRCAGTGIGTGTVIGTGTGIGSNFRDLELPSVTEPKFLTFRNKNRHRYRFSKHTNTGSRIPFFMRKTFTRYLSDV